MSVRAVIGWDIGGAHLKAARLEGESLRYGCWQTPLWRNPDISSALNLARNHLGEADGHLVAFSGESADCFKDRRLGVAELASQFSAVIGEARFYTIRGEAKTYKNCELPDLAAANWHAAATALAENLGDAAAEALWLDIGSTTTDVVCPGDFSPMDDFARLKSRNLLYRGVLRTPVMAVTREVKMGGVSLPLVAEYFADMGDVYCLAGRRLEGESADGQPRDEESCARRLLRMVGRDYEPRLRPFALELAATLRKNFESQLKEGIATHVTAKKRLVIASGIGDFIAEEWAGSRGMECAPLAGILLPFLSRAQSKEASKHGPAVALAWLASR